MNNVPIIVNNTLIAYILMACRNKLNFSFLLSLCVLCLHTRQNIKWMTPACSEIVTPKIRVRANVP